MKRYSIKYPRLDSYYIYTTQQEIKDFIKTFDTIMIESGLVRAPDTGQLDTNDIKDLDFHTKLTYDPDQYRENATTSGSVSFKPLVYCFSDSLQSTNPVYVSFTFEYGKVCRGGSNALKLPVGLYCVIRVGNSTDSNSNIINPISIFPYYSIFDNSGRYEALLTNYSIQDSIINYDKEKGILFLNVLPFFKFAAPQNAQGTIFTDSGSTIGFNRSLIEIIVYRADNETIGVFSQNMTTGTVLGQTLVYGSGTISRINKRFAFKSGSTSFIDTLQQSVGGYYTSSQTYINGRIITSPVVSFNPEKKLMIRNPILLLSSSVDTGGITGGTLNVIINDLEKYRYMVYATNDQGFSYNNVTTMNLLVYDGKVE